MSKNRLTFGTAGMRALMGRAPDQINSDSIRIATQGLANYLGKSGSVVIGYDSRHNSKAFALEAARTLAANKIRAHLFEEMRPTPLISFACRELKASAAIMITASHNPKEYNGYKVYWADGSQVTPPHDQGIIDAVHAIESADAITLAPEDDPLIIHIGTEMDAKYLEVIRPLALLAKQNQHAGAKLKIVFTPLHGVGQTLMGPALAQCGFTEMLTVPEQAEPDGSFPTTKVPNPEESEALKLGIALMEKEASDILLATDPDADRIGLAVRHDGKTHILNGNQIAALCIEHICRKSDPLPERAAFACSIVTSPLFKAIAHAYQKPCFEVLTGFKYIGALITAWEEHDHPYDFIFGAEESYGYLHGTHARDKDAITAGCLIAEIALDAKLEGKTLVDRLDAIYEKYGNFQERLYTITTPKVEKATKIVDHYRSYPPKTLAGETVITITDYKKSLMKCLDVHEEKEVELPKSNVLSFTTDKGTTLILRPSGTEPKLKFYMMTRGDDATSKLEKLQEEVKRDVSEI